MFGFFNVWLIVVDGFSFLLLMVQGNFDAANLITDTDNTNQLLSVNDLTGDFGQPANASTSTGSPFESNLTIAKYNNKTTTDDIMRIASQ